MQNSKTWSVDLNSWRGSVESFFKNHFSRVSADTLGWLAALAINFATIPTLLAALSGLTDKMPPVDMVLFIWGGLMLLFFRAVLLKDMLNIITIGLGFVVQAVIMALMIFK